jgi:hypothetical protein
MIEAFIRGDNRLSRDLLAADPSLSHSRHSELRSGGQVPRAQQKLRAWFQSGKTTRSVAHVVRFGLNSPAEQAFVVPLSDARIR